MFIEGSVIQKCRHGIYLASPEEIRTDKARYCTFCTPDVPPADPNWQTSMKSEPEELDDIVRRKRSLKTYAMASIRRV